MARPATGQTPVMGFRPPTPLREEFEALAAGSGRSASSALIEAMHDWVNKKRREQQTADGTPEGRHRLCERIDAGRPIAHVAAEAGISRRCLAKWYARWRAHGENGLLDHSSRPAASPTRTSEDIANLVEEPGASDTPREEQRLVVPESRTDTYRERVPDRRHAALGQLPLPVGREPGQKPTYRVLQLKQREP